MSTNEPVEAFDEFLENLKYARSLVKTGPGLVALQVRALEDVTDLYRAAWSQSVAGLDHWITREITERAVFLALRPDLPRPPKFSKLEIPVEAFEQVHREAGELGEVLRRCWGEKFARVTHQSPERIKEGLSFVTAGDLWPKVAEIMSRAGSPIKADQVRERLRAIVDRRNRIAHTADRNPAPPPGRAKLTAEETADTIDWLEEMARAILEALGGPLNPEDLVGPPEEVDEPGLVLTGPQWDERSLLHALEKYGTPEASDVLLTVYRHAETHAAFRGYSFGAGTFPSVSAYFRVGQDEASVWSIYTGSDKSVLSINFEWMRARGFPVERLARLVDSLMRLPGAERVLGNVAAADYAKRPSLTPEMLTGGSDVIIAALDELLASNIQGGVFRFMPQPLSSDAVPVWELPLEERLVDLAESLGFVPSHLTKKKLELVNLDRGQVVYLDREKTPSGTIAVIVPPWSDLEMWASDTELSVPVAGRYFHSTNLRVFPRRRNRGEAEIHHGYSIVCRTEEAFQRLMKQV
ncbi:HEPN domain-containing protein [Planotetraspora sp. GP83]|uniref:HEPN domain-containing protein n=1 Tax=Planotetraspora sp. GP83 TaxID=3156264 RepID=UPI003519D79B